MSHELYWDEDSGCVRFDIRGVFEIDDARQLLDQLPGMFEDHGCRLLLIDHSQSRTALPADTREHMRKHAGDVGAEKLAFFGMSNLTRITAQIITRATGLRDKAAFFKTEAQALAWLYPGRPPSTP